MLTCIAFVGFGKYQLKSIEESYDITDVTYESLSNSLQMMNKLTEKTFGDMEKQVQADADKFLDEQYLDTMNKELQRRDSYLIVRKQDAPYYVGDPGGD